MVRSAIEVFAWLENEPRLIPARLVTDGTVALRVSPLTRSGFVMDQALLDRILRSPKLPTLPAIAVRILELTQDVNVSIRELAATIENDQAIAARVLRTVNSSFYGLRRPCTNINQALVMLGLSTVKTLALSFSLVSTLRGHDEDGFDHVDYWRRGLFSAVAARLIAQEARLPNTDEAFLGALLQDIGMMAMYQTLGKHYLAVMSAAPDHRKLAHHELAELEMQHPDVGALLGQRWKLPPELVIAIKYHEQPAAAPPDFAPLVRTVGLANIASDVLTARHPGAALRQFHACAARWFNLSSSSSDELLRQITSGADEVSSLFLLNIGDSVDTESILARAEDQLAELSGQADLGDSDDAPIRQLVSDSQQFDPLTGTLTRRALLTKSLELFNSDSAQRGWLCVAALEIDGFARFLASTELSDADTLLVETASVLDQHFAGIDATIARWEGAIFLIMAPGLDEGSMTAILERVRQSLQRQAPSWLAASKCASLSWSAGVASGEVALRSSSAQATSLFAEAIRALEGARASGRNSTQAAVIRIAA